METLQKARETQLRNIESKTGKSFDELRAFILASGLSKHGEIRSMMMEKFGIGYGDANSLVHYALATDGQTAAEGKGDDEVLDGIYSGKKEGLRPLHNTIMDTINTFGEFEIVPKKGYISLRRKKQFAMVGPATNDAIEIGLNAKELPEDARLKVMPPNSMCRFTTRLKTSEEFDEALQSWLRTSFSEAG